LKNDIPAPPTCKLAALEHRRTERLGHGRTTENVMIKRILTATLATSVLLWSLGLASAQSSGTAAEARAMLDNAAAALKANEATALAAFNDKSNTKFHDRDLYVFCYDMTDGKFTAHTNSAMMGTDVRTLKVKDDPLGQRIFDTINKSSGGSVLTVDYFSERHCPTRRATISAVPPAGKPTMMWTDRVG
jgi:hypothetical protein